MLLLGVTVVAAAAVALAAIASNTPPDGHVATRSPGSLSFRLLGTSLLTVDLGKLVVDGRVDRARLEGELRRRLRPVRGLRRGRARIVYRLARDRAVHDALALGPRGGRVNVRGRALSASVTAPVVRQRLRNNCESAALQILLATTGVSVDQLRLQREFRRDGPPDPDDSGDGRIWGDPDVGYVGRSEGGGLAGGFGIYPGPVAAAARRHGRVLDQLTGSPASRIYARLRQGRAVMAWVGLSDGPYGEWRSPRGRMIRVNFGEHTVVLTGTRSDGRIRVVNPLEGTRELWTRERFETRWARLGSRALGT